MIDASLYSDKVQEKKKNEFMRLLNFLGAKTVNIEDNSSGATAAATNVGVSGGVDGLTSVGIAAGHSTNADVSSKFQIEIVNAEADKNIKYLREFVAAKDCRGGADLIPFFEEEQYKYKFKFLREEESWQQMAYSRIQQNQTSIKCTVTYKTTSDKEINANAKFLAEAFQLKVEKYQSESSSTTVMYAVTFHGANTGEKSALTRPSSTTDRP
jgi:hypothetical protein